MDNVRPNKLDLDDLYEYKKQSAINTAISYNRIIERIHNRIKQTSRQKGSFECCWFAVPEIELGTPKYNVQDCIAYIIQELTDNGFKVKYTHPNLLFIAWNHWIPDYVRNEYKKKTGVAIDGTGQELVKEERAELSNPFSNFSPSRPKPASHNYRPTTSFVPSGRLMVNKSMFPN